MKLSGIFLDRGEPRFRGIINTRFFMGGCADSRSIRPLGGFSPPARRFQAVDAPVRMCISCLNESIYTNRTIYIAKGEEET